MTVVTSDDLNRIQLSTKIEEQIFRLNDKITENTWDFVHVYVMQNRDRMPVYVDPEQMKAVLEIVKLASREGFQKFVPDFLNNIDKELESFTEAKNPLATKSKQK